MDFSILNEENIEDIKNKHNNSLNWQKFAKMAGKNPYLKSLKEKKCMFCHLPIKDSFVLHHLTYDFECPEPIVSINAPTPKKPDRFIEVPDCENCQNKCVDKFVPVHSYCAGVLSKTSKMLRREIGEAEEDAQI